MIIDRFAFPWEIKINDLINSLKTILLLTVFVTV